jgi:hypothetical protein
MRDYNYNIKHGISNYPIYNKISNDKLDIVLLKDFNDSTIENIENIETHEDTNFKNDIFQNEKHLSGSIFGGGKETLLKLIELYYQYFEEYLNKNLFIGCDQQILATLCVRHPELFNLVTPPPHQNIIDEWFYMYHYYSID